MPGQYEFIRKFEGEAQRGDNWLFVAPSIGYLQYWFRELFEYLEKNSHENHTPHINRATQIIEYRGANLYFRVIASWHDIEKLNGIRLKDWFNPGTLSLKDRATINARVR